MGGMNLKTKILLPENVAKLLSSSSNVEAGFFSKKPLTNKEALKLLDKYSNEFKKLFSKLANKIDDPKLLLDYTIKSMEEVKKEKSEKKSGFFKQRMEDQKVVDKEEDKDLQQLIFIEEISELKKKYENIIENSLLSKIGTGEKINVKNKNTEKVKKEFEKLKQKYSHILNDTDMNFIIEEIIMNEDGEAFNNLSV